MLETVIFAVVALVSYLCGLLTGYNMGCKRTSKEVGRIVDEIKKGLCDDSED